MNKEQQRIKIAEACGWTGFEKSHGYAPHPTGIDPLDGRREDLLDYCNDLNAMHEAEKYFDGKPVDLRSLWIDNLAVCSEWPKTTNAMELKFEVSYAMQRLAADPRAEAFLKTLNVWEE